MKGTPTILVEDVRSGRSTILRGLAVETKLDAALAEVTKGPKVEKTNEADPKSKNTPSKEKIRDEK